MKGRLKGKAAVLAAAAVCLLAVAAAWCFGYTSVRSTVRVGCRENTGLHSWSASYFYLDGFMERTIYPAGSTLSIAVTTESGEISIEIEDDNGDVLFCENGMGTGTFQAASTSGRVVVTIRTEKHRGSFAISS